ncbi:unnamed protein product [Mycetohabitans rhizoxinica HKI 454]|uniref:Uncharacterized protein n=1 Tax=Mycetohabitans rhizoxinica (strain DSM 19002 / CIP 109453 / HKI 454) TaxID=882378 RepID=E5AS06_MYCRK|nr:unnamed protein product [Mycetohabitans rhizoxinica HKI 454]
MAVCTVAHATAARPPALDVWHRRVAPNRGRGGGLRCPCWPHIACHACLPCSTLLSSGGSEGCGAQDGAAREGDAIKTTGEPGYKGKSTPAIGLGTAAWYGRRVHLQSREDCAGRRLAPATASGKAQVPGARLNLRAWASLFQWVQVVAAW